MAMHSALLVVKDGKLYQWSWAEQSCADSLFARSDALGLKEEVVTSIVASPGRASILTASGKVASLMDPAFIAHPSPRGPNETPALYSLEHAATAFVSFESDPIASLAVCDTMTIVVTAAGRYVESCG